MAIPKVGILLIINFFIGTTFTIFTYAFQPDFINVLHQTSKSLTVMFIIFGTLGVLMQTVGISFLSPKFHIIGILFIGLFVRSLSFLLMPVFSNLVYQVQSVSFFRFLIL
ncbi:MAG: hypothetical protein ACHBN1_24660 [Heteroscytonema crispum UTEX LB 1556]